MKKILLLCSILIPGYLSCAAIKIINTSAQTIQVLDKGTRNSVELAPGEQKTYDSGWLGIGHLSVSERRPHPSGDGTMMWFAIANVYPEMSPTQGGIELLYKGPSDITLKESDESKVADFFRMTPAKRSISYIKYN